MATKVINSLTFGDTYVLTTPYATCSTAAGTAAKVATITPGSAFSLETGVRVSVKFTNALSVAAPTLNVNSSGAKAIYFRGATLTSAQYWAAGSTVDFVFDGTYWQMLGSQHNSTYSLSSFGVTSSAAELNILDGVTATTAEINKLDGLTTSTTELNYVDGVTSNIQTQLNNKSDYKSLLKCSCPDGTGGYIKICKIPMPSTYSDKTLEFTIASRSCKYQRVIVQLQTSTPATCVNTRIFVSGAGGNYYNVHGYRYNAGTAGEEYIEIWCTLPTWDSVSIFRKHFYTNRSEEEITWYAERVTSLPTTSSTIVKFNATLEHWSGTAENVAWSGVTGKPTYYDAKAINGITRSGTTFTYTCLDGTTGTFTQQDSDTKVTQNAAITTAGNYPVILGNSTYTTAVTGSVNKSATLLFDPSSSTLIVGSTETGGYEEEPIGNLYVSGDAIIGGGSDSFGIIPGQDNYSHVGTSNRRWFDGHFTNMYCNNYYDYNGNSLTSQFLPKSGGTLTGATTVNAGVALQLNTLKLPTTSGGTTYGVGSSGQVLKSNGSTVYWGSDSNTTYSYPNLMGCSCNTVDSTAAKTASLNGFSSTHLKVGAAVFVRFTYPHTGTTAATFNLSSTGAKTIKRAGKSVTEGNSWAAYEIVKLIYDGTYWQYISMSGPEWHQYST